jgi:ADP-heptose:LPS heptosyltransferase/SAM-dependent methyltransferase
MSEEVDKLQALQLENNRLLHENRALADKLGLLGQLETSRGIRYVKRLERDLLSGGVRDKMSLAHDIGWEARMLAQQVSTRPAPAAEGAAPQPAPTENLRIAFSHIGGMGDMVWTTAILEALKKKYLRSEITLFVNKEQHRQVFADNPCVAEVVVIHPDHLTAEVRALVDAGRFDLWFESHYATKAHFGPSSRAPADDREATARAFAGWSLNFDDWPLGNNVLSFQARQRGRNLLELVAESCALPLADPQARLFPSYDDLAIVPFLERFGDYVTVHHGADRAMAGRNGLQTKNWFRERWEAVIAHVTRDLGLAVLQVGSDEDERLAGANHFFLGRTNVRESAAVLQGARFHLDTEGGLVHLARAMHTPSVVLFGPTPSSFFGYPQNRAVVAGDCHGCWWSTPDWSTSCPLGMAVPSCMDAITVDRVIAEVDAAVRESAEQRAARPELCDFTLFDGKIGPEHEKRLEAIYRSAEIEYGGPHKDARSDRTGAYVHGSKNWEYVYALDQIDRHATRKGKMRVLDVGAGRGALSLHFADLGHESHICDLGYSVHSHNGREYGATFLESLAGRVDFRFGSAFNLPYESGSFDAVVCISVVEHLQFKQLALREMLRVLRPGGLLVLTFDVLPTAADLMRFTDWNRVEIFTNDKIRDDLAALGIDHEPGVEAIAASVQAMQRFGIDGFPEGLTVGGLAIRKLAVPSRAR